MDENRQRVTGKQVLTDFVTLFKDTGIFLYDAARLAVIKLKSALKTEENKTEIQASVPVQ